MKTRTTTDQCRQLLDKTPRKYRKLFACALANTPPEVRVVHLRRDLAGAAHINPKDPNYGMLQARAPRTLRALHVYLH
jgi:hypothetical protein